MKNLMSIEEMKKHKWSISWSGGKDSTATIILAHEQGIPIESITYVRMMFNDEIPATLPIMTDFVDNARDVFESWGYKVNFIKSQRTAFELSEKVFKKSIHNACNGQKYGVCAFCRGACRFQQEKPLAISKVTKSYYELIGYAADETKRIYRLGGGQTINISCIEYRGKNNV